MGNFKNNDCMKKIQRNFLEKGHKIKSYSLFSSSMSMVLLEPVVGSAMLIC